MLLLEPDFLICSCNSTEYASSKENIFILPILLWKKMLEVAQSDIAGSVTLASCWLLAQMHQSSGRLARASKKPI